MARFDFQHYLHQAAKLLRNLAGRLDRIAGHTEDNAIDTWDLPEVPVRLSAEAKAMMSSTATAVKPPVLADEDDSAGPKPLAGSLAARRAAARASRS